MAYNIRILILIIILESILLGFRNPLISVEIEDPSFQAALQNGRAANEGFIRCQKFVRGYLQHADPKTGLTPRYINRNENIWNAQDCAADCYPFMVLTAAIIDRPLFNGRMLNILRTEIKLTSRIGAMPDTYSFSKQTFLYDQPDFDRIIFGSSEYIKDGLLPLTEWLGPSPWRDRMMNILEDMWKHASVDTPYGSIVSTNIEVNGEMLQILSRIFWMSGEKKYLEWAIRLGDYYLLGKHHPTRDQKRLRLRDHGCEIVSGLCELYASVHFARPEKKKAYQPHIHAMLDRILEIGRNEHGLFYDWIDTQTGKHDNRPCDTWGYTYNGFYTVYLLDGTESYRQAVLKALGSLNRNYRNYRWEGDSADGYADTIESAINLYNREPVPSVARWIDSETRVMWDKQRPNGIIDQNYADGNFARTTIMYCLWKTQGLTVVPWREDIVFGAVCEDQTLKIAISCLKPWQGKIIFDIPRHITYMHLPLDWPRINQFPEWFVVRIDQKYHVVDGNKYSQKTFTGKQLHQGFDVQIKPGTDKLLIVK